MFSWKDSQDTLNAIMDLLFNIVDSYIRIYRRLPHLPVEFDPKTRRVFAISDTKELLGCIFGSVCMGVFVVGPKFLQVLYLTYRWVELGHFPKTAEEPFASPMQLFSIAMEIITSGGGTVFIGVAYLFNKEVCKIINELLNLEEDLARRCKSFITLRML